MSAVAELRARLALVLGEDRVEGEAPLGTGHAPLDAALRGGLPRGRVTELVGTPGSGATTLMRRVVEATARRDDGLWCAVVDATRTLAPGDWAHLGGHEGVWIVRPHDATRAAWCADVLLRSGAFALVVLDGTPALPRPVAVRLERLAKEHDAALLVVRDATAPRGALPSTLRLRVSAGEPRGGWRARGTLTVQVERGGAPRKVELPRTIVPPTRLLRHPEPPDRRGTARRVKSRG